MTITIDAIHITKLQQDANRNLDAGDLRSAMPLFEESHLALKEFSTKYGDTEYTKLISTIRLFVEHSDTSVFVALTRAPYTEDYGDDIGTRIVEAAYAGMVGVFEMPYFAHVESFVTIDHELPDPIVMVRDLDEKRNGHFSRLVQEFVQWAHTEAVSMVEAE